MRDLDTILRADLDGMPEALSHVLDDWLHRAHGVVSSHHNVGLFLDLLYEAGYAVEPVEVASARSYTTIETLEIDRSALDHDALTEGQIKAEDPTWGRPDDPDAPVRHLG